MSLAPGLGISRRAILHAGSATAFALGCRTLAGAAQPGSSSRDNDARHLFLDSRGIHRCRGMHLVPGTVRKDPGNPLMREDRPWEPRFDNLYANVLYDAEENLYKCWYSPFIVDKKTTGTPRELRPYRRFWPNAADDLEMGVCYATSKDGIEWRKPELGLIEYNGSTRNNLVMRQGREGWPAEPHGVGIFKDKRETDPARRYKAFLNMKRRAIALSFSSDGLRWSAPLEFPQIDAVGDTHNNLLWSPELRRWVGITRLWDRNKRQRLVGRTESTDLMNWGKAIEVLRALPEERWRQTYAMPVFRHAGVYLGLLMLLNVDGDNDTVDCELAWSADTLNWERIAPGTPLIPRGELGSYDSLCLYAGAYPIHLEEEIRIYYGGNNGKHTSYRDGFFCLARLRPDGYAAMVTDRKGEAGVIETEVRECAGKQLRVSVDAAGGSLRVAVIDAAGYTLEECEPITGDVTDAPVRWKTGSDFSKFLGRHARFRFEARDTKLYSYSFA